MPAGKRRHPMYEGVALLADPIYGYVHFTVPIEGRADERTEKDLIDTPWMQRLRRVHQLQSSFWVFPSAEHSRFQHSLGTMHMAGRFADRLYPSLKQAFDRCPSFALVKELLRVTGLVHDIGHGPFSHFFDHHYLEPACGTTHEGLGQQIVTEKLADLIRGIRRSPDGAFKPGETLEPEHVAFLVRRPEAGAERLPGWLRTLQPVFSGHLHRGQRGLHPARRVHDRLLPGPGGHRPAPLLHLRDARGSRPAQVGFVGAAAFRECPIHHVRRRVLPPHQPGHGSAHAGNLRGDRAALVPLRSSPGAGSLPRRERLVAPGGGPCAGWRRRTRESGHWPRSGRGSWGARSSGRWPTTTWRPWTTRAPRSSWMRWNWSERSGSSSRPRSRRCPSRWTSRGRIRAR